MGNCLNVQKRKMVAGGVAQVVECLPSKHEVLSSNPSTEKKKRIQTVIDILFYTAHIL
jgi:hypothetical protein